MNLKIQKPFDGDFRITQKFGAKYLYFGKTMSHNGIDWACSKRTPIYAAHDGEVVRAQINPSKKGYGNEIRIRGEECTTQFAHLDEIVIKIGATVKSGDLIGYSGNSGFTIGENGYHLHFGVIVENKWVDPEPLIFEKAEDATPSDEVSETDKIIGATVEKCKQIFSEMCADLENAEAVKKASEFYFQKLDQHFYDG